MKIRKLILKAKLQQIQEQYQYIFIYHCSGLNNLQWRKLKDLLQKTNCKTFFQPKRRQKQSRMLFSSKKSLHVIGRSTWLINSKSVKLLKQNVRPLGALMQMNSKLASLGGPSCLFYISLRACCPRLDNLNNHSNQTFEESGAQLHSASRINTVNTRISWCASIKEIESLDYQSHLILFYAHITSSLLNHMDIKESLNLETQPVYQKLLHSILNPIYSLDSCLCKNSSSLATILTASRLSPGCAARRA